MNEQPTLFGGMPVTGGSTANGLTWAIIRYIQARGGQAERINVIGRPITARHGGREYIVSWAQSHMTVGTADISATIHGRSVKIEVKVGKDRQSDAQRRYQQSIEAAGGIYYIASGERVYGGCIGDFTDFDCFAADACPKIHNLYYDCKYKYHAEGGEHNCFLKEVNFW